MNIIKRNIFLLTDSIQAPICIVEGSDLYSMEFTVRDFNIPEGASAVAYAAGVKSKTKTRICEIDGNTIKLDPTDKLFEEGFNMLQIRIFSGEKSITSFNNPVHCHKSIVTDDASETESDPTLLEQILSKLNTVPGGEVTPGTDGGYYKPTVDTEGNLSWKPSKTGMPGVESVNIKGKDGVGIQSVEQTVTSEASGGRNTVEVRLSNGNKSTFHVYNGKAGVNGAKGETGVGILTVKQTTTSSSDGGTNVITVTKTDGSTSTFSVKNGSKGSKGDAGSDASVTSENIKTALGYLPAKQTDVDNQQVQINGKIDKTYVDENYTTKSEYNSLKETVEALTPSKETQVETVFQYTNTTAQHVGYVTVSDGKAQDLISSHKFTNPIPVNANSAVKYKINGTAAIAVIAFYDKNNAYISGVAGNGSLTEGTATVPENAAFVVFTFAASTSGQYGEVLYVSTGETNETITRYYNIGGTAVNDTDVLATALGFYNTSGELLSTSGYNYVPIFPVKGTVVGTLPYTAKKVATVARICFYDKNQTFISCHIHEQNANSLFFIAPERTAFVSMSFVDGQKNDYIVLAQYETEESASMDSLQEWLEKAKQSLNPLYGKKLVVTGDSITQGGSLPKGSYATMIAADNNMTFQNKAIWGAIFATGVKDSNGKSLDSIYPTIAQMDADADYVIISGGVNDFSYMYLDNEPVGSISKYYEGVNYDTGTYCGALEQMCKDALVKWAGKKVLFVIEHRMNGIQMEDRDGELDYLVKNSYMPLTKAILEKWGMPYVDLYTSTPTLLNINYLKENYTVGDGWHPNEAGYRAYYIPQIEAKLKSI